MTDLYVVLAWTKPTDRQPVPHIARAWAYTVESLAVDMAQLTARIGWVGRVEVVATTAHASISTGKTLFDSRTKGTQQ